ncbi:MAG TPA: sodium:proline symporter [Gallionellaceae bacterium]
MAKQDNSLQHVLIAIIWAGVAAGIVSTLAQLLLWLVLTDEFPAALFRDARLTAALVLGVRVLAPPATFDAVVWLVATLVHFSLSIGYAALLATFAMRFGNAASLLAGAGFGVALYAVNLHGFTEMFPWFAQARGWITVAAHALFGMTAIWVFRRLYFRNARSQPAGR